MDKQAALWEAAIAEYMGVILEQMPARDRETCLSVLSRKTLRNLFCTIGQRVLWQLDLFSVYVGGRVPCSNIAARRQYVKMAADSVPEDDPCLVKGLPVVNRCQPLGREVYFMTTIQLVQWLSSLQTKEADQLRMALSCLMYAMEMAHLARGAMTGETDENGDIAVTGSLVRYAQWNVEWAEVAAPVEENAPDNKGDHDDNDDHTTL
jgi:hypothetical protein